MSGTNEGILIGSGGQHGLDTAPGAEPPPPSDPCDDTLLSSTGDRQKTRWTHETSESVYEEETEMSMDGVRKHLLLVIEDAERDARALDRQPFDGRTVAENFGYAYAQIQALGKMLLEVMDELGAVR